MTSQQSFAATPDPSVLLETSFYEDIPKEALQIVLATHPFVPIPAAMNLRTLSGPNLAPGIVFRSGGISHLPPSSLALLKSAHNITTIFDLRSRDERNRHPEPEVEGIEIIWIPSTIDAEPSIDSEKKDKLIYRDVKPADFVLNGGKDGHVALYGNMLHTHKLAYKTFFERLRDGKGGVLFHCTAGRDRTGVLAALIHALVETPEDLISQDYALTRIGVEPFRDALVQSLLQQMGRPGDLSTFEEPGMQEMCEMKGANILAFLDSLDGVYGVDEDGRYKGAKGYLTRELGLTDVDLESIGKRLVVK